MEHVCLGCSSETNFREQRQSCFSVRNAQKGKFVNVFHFWDSSKPSLIPVSGLPGRFLVNGTDFTNSKLNKLTRFSGTQFPSLRTICPNRGPTQGVTHANGKQPESPKKEMAHPLLKIVSEWKKFRQFGSDLLLHDLVKRICVSPLYLWRGLDTIPSF